MPDRLLAARGSEIVSGCAPWGINEFTFSPYLQTFDMLAAIVSSDADTETAMALHGTLVEAVADPPVRSQPGAGTPPRAR